MHPAHKLLNLFIEHLIRGSKIVLQAQIGYVTVEGRAVYAEFFVAVHSVRTTIDVLGTLARRHFFKRIHRFGIV